jgi:hypothetical protein
MCWDSTVDTIHRDDIKVVGHLDRSVAYVEIDWEAVERRRTEEIHANIANRKKFEEKLTAMIVYLGGTNAESN